MDYDDNDFQCQNFQLVGEDNNKFPASLRPFPLPKFELEEHLQVHLRFDSLIGTEVLLGIQDQGNNWIKDFSPADSAIEFSSSAAESCSISRHNNVWSEATSSESVEMLLKSVGEDEMIEQQTIIKEADAHDGLNVMDGHMDTCLRQNDSHTSSNAEIEYTDPALPPDKCHKGLSGPNEDAVSVQHLVEGTSRSSKAEIDVDLSCISEKFNCEGKNIAKLCSMGKNLTSSSDYATKISSLIDEPTCGIVENDNPLHDASMNCAADEQGCNASAVAEGSSDAISCRNTQDDHSSPSTSDPVMGPGKLNTQMILEQVMEECSKIDIGEKPDLLSDDAQKESSHIRDSKVNDQPSQGPVGKSGLCNTNGSSFLEPIMDSLLLNGGCNEPVFSENPDGLLEAITCQVKAPSKENQTIDKIALRKNEGYSLVLEGDGDIYQDSATVINDDISDLSHLTEGFMNAGYGESEYLSKDNTAHVESTLSIKNPNIGDSYKANKLNSLLKVIEERHDPEDQLTDDKNSDDGNTSRSSVKVHSSINMSYELPTEESKNSDDLVFNPLNFNSPDPNVTVLEKYAEDEVVENIVRKPEEKLNAPQDDILDASPSSPALFLSCELPTKEIKDDDLGLNPVNFDSQNPNFVVVEKYAEDEVVENIVKKPEDKLNAPHDDKLEESPSSTLLNDAEKISFSIPRKSFDIYDTGTLTAEPYDVRAIPPDVAAITKESTALPLNSGRSKSKDDASLIKKMEDASSAGCKITISTVADCSSVKKLIQDKLALTGPDSMDVNLHSLNNSANVYQSQHGQTHVVDVLVEQKEAIIPPLPVSDFIQLEDKELEIDISTLKCNLDGKISRESNRVSDAVVLDGSSVKDMVQDDPGVRLVSVKNLITFHQSESEDIKNVVAVVEQEEEPMSVLPVLDFIDSDEKETKTSAVTNLSGLKFTVGSQLSSGPIILSYSGKDSPITSPTELQPIVGQHSSSMEGSFCVAFQNKLPSSTGSPVRHENATRLEENLVSHVSSVEGKSVSDSLGSSTREDEENTLIVSEIAIHDQRQAMRIPPSSMKSSYGDCLKEQSTEADLAPGYKCNSQNYIAPTEGDALNCCTNRSSESFATTKTNGESYSVDAESANATSFEENCGSPIVISCSEHSQDEMYREGNRGLPDLMDPASDGIPFVSSRTRGNDGKVIAHDTKENTTSDEDRSFTFEVGSLADLSERDNCNKWKPFSSFESQKMSKENAEACLLEPEERELHGPITKTLDEDKTRQVSVCPTERLATSQGKAAKETPILKQTSGRDGDPCTASPKPVGTVSRIMQLAEIQHYPYIESSIKASCAPTSQMSTLPDLNTSVSSAAVFHQPFTDLQQVQLRAQIFVYGSLIQGIPPDEACMISAFGEPDGGRSLWEAVWLVSAETYQNQKSPFSSSKTPHHSHSGVQVSEQATKYSSLHSKTPSTPACQSGSKVVPSTKLNSTMPLPSPVWSISTRDGLHSNTPRVAHLDFNQALSPPYSQHSSQLRQYTCSSATLLSQIPRTGPRVVTSQVSALDITAQNSAQPVTETVQVTTVRDCSIPIETQRKAIHGNSRSASTVEKARKRKKGSVPVDLHLNMLVSQPLGKPDPVIGVSKHSPPTATGLPVSANSLTKLASTGLVSSTCHIIPPTTKTCSEIEQAKLQAEDAAALAASVVRQSQGIWSQLAAQKNSGLVSEVDERLASAAVAAAAAVSVAKAAAAAAKVASDAALQAKMMADEALSSVKPGNLTQNSETGLVEVGKGLVRLTPVSILKGRDKVHGSSLIISAAREAARRRVEAASAATKRAENLEAIVKAAELAAAAVSQAGTIVAMGEPLPFTFSELVEAGPESHWKIDYSTTHKLAKTNNLHQEELLAVDCADNRDKSVERFNKQPSNNKEKQKTTDEEGILSFSEHSMESKGHNKGNGSGNASSPVRIDRHEKDRSAIIHIENSILKGSLVEVVSDEDGLRRVWFSARVLDVKDGKAYVCYNDLLPDEGTGQLKEWISLESEGNKAPKIRLAHPMTAAKYEGTRKRRREAVGSYVWAVGDRVDAWIRDGWWEGIVTEKCQGDDTKVTVHFPAGGDSSIARAWNLRPSLVWKDGHWMEWARENALQFYEGDIPREKRQKLGRLDRIIEPEVDGKGSDKLSKNFAFEVSGKPEESRRLNLSAKNKTFSIGKNAREANKFDALKVRRTGLQKEGSRVVFGVPKPGKKRKFMEVSKHYDEDKMDKITDGNNSIKFAKYLMPQASLMWRNSSRADPKRKIAGDSKSKGIKSVKPQCIKTRNIAAKDNSSRTRASNGGETSSLPNAIAAFGNEQDNLEKKSLVKVDSLANSLESIESSHVGRSVQSLPGALSSKKSSSAVEANLGVKGKLTPAMDKSNRSEEKGYENPGNTISDAPEPRRSNRRIQPTSRLLEGLQSSLTVPKVPSFSHDKSNKAHQRAASSGGNSQG